MAINKIITEKTLNYIETLYIYANLEQFLTYKSTAHDWLFGELKPDGSTISVADVDNIYASEKYTHMMNYLYDTMLHNAEFLGNANGRAWYKFPNYRLGIMDYDTAKKSNQFNVEIQYTQAHMFTLDPSLKGLDLPFNGTLDQYHIKRIDVSQIVKTPKDYLTNYSFISPYRAMDRFSKNGQTETVYLGHRKSGNVFRMYNKTIELKVDNKDHPIDFKKIEMFGQYFGDIENLYTFELELHRKYIKPTFGIDTLADLDKVYRAYGEIVGKIKLYEDTDQNRKHIKLKHHDRIKDLLQFTEYKEFKRLKSKKYKPSESFLINKTIATFNKYDNSLKEPMQEHEKLILLDKILTGILNASDISIEINDFEKEEFELKVERLKHGQTNELYVEAKTAFGYHPFVAPVPVVPVAKQKEFILFQSSLF